MPDQIDLRKLQPLGTVQGHQRNRIAGELRFLVLFDSSRSPRHIVVQKPGQRGLFGSLLVRRQAS